VALTSHQENSKTSAQSLAIGGSPAPEIDRGRTMNKLLAAPAEAAIGLSVSATVAPGVGVMRKLLIGGVAALAAITFAPVSSAAPEYPGCGPVNPNSVGSVAGHQACEQGCNEHHTPACDVVINAPMPPIYRDPCDAAKKLGGQGSC
jgi:hypothetical protein